MLKTKRTVRLNADFIYFAGYSKFWKVPFRKFSDKAKLFKKPFWEGNPALQAVKAVIDGPFFPAADFRSAVNPKCWPSSPLSQNQFLPDCQP